MDEEQWSRRYEIVQTDAVNNSKGALRGVSDERRSEAWYKRPRVLVMLFSVANTWLARAGLVYRAKTKKLPLCFVYRRK